MKGQLKITNAVQPMVLGDFKQEAFMHELDLFIMLYEPVNIKKGKGIPCFCVNIPGIVFLDPETEVEPIDLEITAT